MRGVDVEQVRERAREIRESIRKVRQYAAQPDEEFFADERNIYTVMHLLLIAVEAIGGHLQSHPGKDGPQGSLQLR